MNGTWTFEEVVIARRGVVLPGELILPERPCGLILFAHGSGSSRHSARNRRVAEALGEAGLASLRFDLLTENEDRSPGARFEIELLTWRLLLARHWVASRPNLASLPVGYFGASTGAAAAVGAAAFEPDSVAAIVSRGGRPDLAGDSLSLVRAPTLLIVGGDDTLVCELNQDALARLNCLKRLAIVPGATHLFEEPGAMEAVMELAADWFGEYLGAPSHAGLRRDPEIRRER